MTLTSPKPRALARRITRAALSLRFSRMLIGRELMGAMG